MRTGSGKEELMNYMSEWCELKQGELETMLSSLANTGFDQNDINNALYQASNDIGTALKLLKTSLNQSPPSIQTTASLVQELSITITSVENSLKKVSEIRSKLQADSIKVDRKC